MPTVRPGVVAKISEKGGILGCINEHDGSGFIHALLEAYHPGYSRLQNDNYRSNLAKSVRIGALPEILRTRYGVDPLCPQGCAEARLLFNKAIAFGSPVPPVLFRSYAQYLGVPYRLYDANFVLRDQYDPPGKVTTSCHIIAASEDEYHLIVRLLPSRRGDPKGVVRYRILS